jgi:hypothetical protein
MYTTRYGDVERKKLAPILVKNNPEQFPAWNRNPSMLVL